MKYMIEKWDFVLDRRFEPLYASVGLISPCWKFDARREMSTVTVERTASSCVSGPHGWDLIMYSSGLDARYTPGLVHTAFGRLQYLSSSRTALSRATAQPLRVLYDSLSLSLLLYPWPTITRRWRALCGG